MTQPAHNRGSALSTPTKAKLRLSKTEKRRALREKCAARVAAGTHVPGQPRSHYARGDVLSLISEAQSEPARWNDHATTDFGWELRSKGAVKPGVTKKLTVTQVGRDHIMEIDRG